MKKPSRDLLRLVNGGNEFALALYPALRSSPGNVFFSPHSISTALGLVLAGARGSTANQLTDVLRFPLEGEALHTAQQGLVRDLAEQKGCELTIANALWGQEGYEFREEYLRLLDEAYGAGLYEVDFQKAPDEARTRINEWAADRTRGRIPELVPPGVLARDVRLVLTNGIYFKGKWERPFDGGRTYDGDFHLPPGFGEEKIPVSMMVQKDSFRHTEQDGIQVLEMPYQGGRFAMLFALPGEVDGLADLEAALDGGTLQRWVRRLRDREVHVHIPKFKMAAAVFLGDILREMGMDEVFDRSRSDLSGIADGEEIGLSEVLHRAFVDVNELGTEAAAATAAFLVGAAIDEKPPPTFRADHPFLFLIRDVQTGAILFLGRVTQPSKAERPSVEMEAPGEIVDGEATLDPLVITGLLEGILEDARDGGVSEIHISRAQGMTTVRFRASGGWRDEMVLPPEVCQPLVTRLKEVCGLDPAVQDVPQKGEGAVEAPSQPDRLQVLEAETSPTPRGEEATIRILGAAGP